MRSIAYIALLFISSYRAVSAASGHQALEWWTCESKLGSEGLLFTCCRTSPTGLSAATIIGKYVTIGQGCLLRSTTVEDQVVIGDRSILMEGSLVESNSVLAPGTVLPPGRLVPSGQLWAGNPARYVRDLSKDEVNHISSQLSQQVLWCEVCQWNPPN